MHEKWKCQYTITPDKETSLTSKQLLRLGVKLIDDLCDAYRVILLPDDKLLRDAMAEQGKE